MEMREEKLEAMKAVIDYNPRLLRGLENVARELSGDRKEDTDEYLKSVIDGINWEIQILNRTMDLVNENEEQVNQDEANELFKSFSAAYKDGDDQKIATSITTELVPFFTKFGKIAEALAEEA